MQKRYIILALLLIGVASGLIFIPEMTNKDQISAKVFLNEIGDQARFVSTDDIAKRIIDQDPILLLVDVRSEDDYNIYSLPGAINIPLANVLDEDWEGYINQNIQDVVFYANDDILSEKAWAVCAQLDFKNLYVLDGGLNRWFATIMLPPKPTETDASDAFSLYDFRVGASIYFGSGSTAVASDKSETPKAPKKTIPIKKKVKREAEGGC